MSMMQNPSAKPQRTRGRPNPSRFLSSRPGGRSRGPPMPEKNIHFQNLNDGVYANPRFTHVSTSLVGSVVQVQVRNKSIYEGLLKTFTSKMDVVLEMAHLVEDVAENNQHTYSNIPTRDRIIDKVIFNLADILSITALDVDLDYAVKDTFTDSAISRYNGQVLEKDLRELQPWDAEGSDEVTLDGDSSNGWDPNEMFKINAQQFNVQSTYDDSLKQYTIPLEKRDTKEFKKREEEASKLAQEIEGSEQYRRRIALENGEGDEEEKFSSVVRPGESGPQTGGGNNASGKYIPPARRNQQNQGRLAQPKPNNQAMNNRPPQPPQAQMVAGPHMQTSTHIQMTGPRLQSPTQLPQSPPQSQSVTQPLESSVITEDRVNGERDDRRQDNVVPANSLSNKTSPIPEQSVGASSVEGRSDSTHSSPNTSKVDRRNSNPKARTAQIQELKDFSSNFKLGEETKEKDRQREKEMEKENENKENVVKTEQPEKVESEKGEKSNIEEPYKTLSDTVKNSVLNPMAKEFNPCAKTFQPKQTHPTQVSTPPRPQTQSPNVPQMPPQAMQPMYHYSHPLIMAPPQSANMQPQQRPKRAVVSVHAPPRGDISAAAAQAATGQPLLAQTVPHQGGGPPYTFTIQMPHQMVPQPTGYQAGQVMPMPAANPNQRMVQSTPMVATSQHHGVDIAGQQGHSQPIFMTPPSGPTGPMPAHVNALHQQQHPNQHASHPTPAHMAGPHATAAQQNQHQQQQGGQMNSQTAVHPAPSPVQHTGPGSQQPHHQAPPPSSGTPQPHIQYQQLGMQQGQHPPLQPSPHSHTPTSPQAMHSMSMPYTLSTHGHMQGGPTFTVAQAHQHSTQGHTLYSQSTHSPHMQPQLVMMPPTHHQGQVQHTHPMQHGHHQFHQGHHMAGPGPVHGQSHVMHQSGMPTGLPLSNNPSSVHPSQLHHFVQHQQVPNQGAPPVQNYQQNQ